MTTEVHAIAEAYLEETIEIEAHHETVIVIAIEIAINQTVTQTANANEIEEEQIVASTTATHAHDEQQEVEVLSTATELLHRESVTRIETSNVTETVRGKETEIEIGIVIETSIAGN